MDREQGSDEGIPVSEEPECEISVGTHSNDASLREWTTRDEEGEDQDHSGMICNHHWDILSKAMDNPLNMQNRFAHPDPRVVQDQ